MTSFILIFAIILLICLFFNKITGRFGVPMLFTFILLGMVFGSDGLFKIPFDNYDIAEKVCSFSLIFIMFYGGFGTNWKQAKPVAVKAVILSSFGTILTALITGLFCYLVLRFSFLESMLIGSVISSTDAASVFFILRSNRLNLKYNTASMLEVESGSNDPFSYMLTILVLSMMNGDFSGGHVVLMIFAQVALGVIFGIVVALVAKFIITRFVFSIDGFDAIFVFSMALISYAGASLIGGNGYLSVYITGIILGNVSFNNKKSLVHFFDGITGLMQILIFFLLGLLSSPSQLPKVLLPALAIAIFMTFVSRPIAIFSLLSPFKCPRNQKLIVSWAGLRGAASIVFAIMATVSPAYMKNDIFHIVFFIVLFSISLQGSLLPVFSKKLNMIDNSSNVMKTFSDYTDEIPIQFIKLSITENHPWADKTIKDLKLLPDLLVVLIFRGEKSIVPKGNTTINPGDIVVLSAPSIDDDMGIYLSEIVVKQDSEWLGMPLSEITLEDEKIVIVIKRGSRVIIPNGKTIIKENDILIINQQLINQQ